MRQRGFTLVEILIAIAILSIAVMLVFQSFVSVTTTTDLARTEAAHLREREYIRRSFAENLNAVYSDPACMVPDFAFHGETDTLSFCTSLPMPGSTALPGQLRGVTYEVGNGGDIATPTSGFSADTPAADSGTYLIITESPVVRGSMDDSGGVSVDKTIDEGMSRVRQVPVSKVTFRYYDGEAQDWVDEWDSYDMQHLPWAVEVLVDVARGPDDPPPAGNGPDMDMTFVLPLGAGTSTQFFDMNHLYVSPDGSSDPNSIFNEQPKGGGRRK